MNLEVKIEIRSIVKKMTSQLAGNTHNFTVLVRGLNGNQIEHFVKQVVFYLPFNSSNSKEVKRTPPYLISGSTHASFRLPIDIFLHTSEARNKVRYSYYVFLPDKPVENAVNVKTLTFLNTPQDFRERLLLGGAEVVNQTKSEEVATHVKSEPVEIIENQKESLGNEPNAEFKVVANKVAADSENTFKKNDEHLVCKTEPTEGADIQNEIHNELPDTCAQSKDISEQSGGLLIQGIYSFDELMKENEILKKENETLFNKFSKQEGVIATYVEKLPVLQNDFSSVSTELGQLQTKSEANEAEISSLKSSIQTLMSEILQQNNKADEVKGQMKRRKKPAVSSSSFVSESFPCMTSISLENEPHTNNSHKVLSKDKGMAINECTISHTSFEFPTLSADSNIIQDACKNQLNSSCNTSENKAASSRFSYRNDNVSACDTAQTVQKAPTTETFLNASHNETVTENSHNFSIQNKPSSCINNLNGTCSINESPWHRISSVYPSKDTMSLGNPSLSRKKVSSVPFLSTESTSTLRELPLSKENISTFDEELQSTDQNFFQKESVENLTERLIQHYAKDKNFSGNLFEAKVAEIASLNHKERNPEHPNVLEVSQGENSSKKEPCKNIFAQATQQCTKGRPQVSSFERRNTEPSNLDPLTLDFKNGNTFEKAVPQCIEIEPQVFSHERDIEPGYLNPQERDSVICDYQNLGQDSFQIIYENISELSTRKCIKREPRDSSVEAKDAEHAILKPGRTNVVNHNIRKLSIQCDSLGRQADKDIFQEVAPQESLPTINKRFDLNPEEMDVVLPDSTTGQDYFHKEICKNVVGEPNQQYVEGDLQIIEDEEHRNSSHKEKDPVPNVLKTSLCQNVPKEIVSNCRKDEVQVFSSNQKETEISVLSCSKRYPVKEIQISTKEDCLEENLHENVFEEVARKQIKRKLYESLSKRKNMKFTNLNHKRWNTMSSNCESISIENNSLQKESTEYLSKKAIQEYVKGGLQVNLNQQNRDPVVSNFIHLKNPSLNMKRTIFLPIPEDRKRPCRAEQNLSSVKQKIMCSVPHAALLNNSNSVKHSTIEEQVCLPIKSSLDTVAIGDKTSFPIPVQIKNTAPENDSALNSVDRNHSRGQRRTQKRPNHRRGQITTEANRNQSVSTCISASARFKKGERNKGFKKRKSETKSSNPIRSIFKDIDDRLISEAKQNYYVHLLTEFLTNPKKCPNISALIFLVIEYLQHSTKNYLQAFSEDRANCIFLPSSESCIVSTLFEIEKKSKTYSQLKLIKNILNTIHHILMAAKILYVYGFASLCRVFTEICKRKSDLMKPFSLCVEILKRKLRFAPYLIASIAGVWREPFMLPSDQSEEAMILLGSVSLGAGKKTKKMDDSNWLCSAELISEYFGFPGLPDIDVALNFLKDKIISNCTQNSFEKSWMVTSSFVILASLQPWEWIKSHLIFEYIIPNLSRFANEEPNEKAFALFCDLCVDVYGLSPCMPHSTLLKYFNQAPNEGSNFVQEWAAVSLIKYLILTRNQIRPELSEWLKNNQEKSSEEKFREFYLRRNIYYKGLKKIRDIVIT